MSSNADVLTDGEGLATFAPRFVLALASGDYAAARDVVDADLELRIPTAPPGVPKVVKGHDGLAALVSNVHRTWTAVTVTDVQVDVFEGNADRGLVQFRVVATNRDGSQYLNDYVALVETAAGKIRGWTEYYDPDHMVGAINALRAYLRKSTNVQ